MTKSKLATVRTGKIGTTEGQDKTATPLPLRAYRRLFSWPIAGLFAILIVAGAYYFTFEWNRVPRIDPTDAAQVEMGKRIYVQACASCHGASLEGQANWQRRLPSGRLPAPPHDASGHTWHHADEVLFRITKYGAGAYSPGHQTDMPAFEQRLTDQEIASSLAFIKSTWSADIQAKQARMNAEARRAPR